MSREVPGILEFKNFRNFKNTFGKAVSFTHYVIIMPMGEFSKLFNWLYYFSFKDLRAFQKHATINSTTKA